jgi:hypothetical protein
MGIDHIGKKGPPVPPAAEPTSGGRVGAMDRPFEVSVPPTVGTSTSAPLAPAAEPRTPLERWRDGEIDLRGYLDLKVDEATAHLAVLPAPELEAIRSALRDRMESDPTLVELARTATGRTPSPPHEE